jgi:hypothetical protein
MDSRGEPIEVSVKQLLLDPNNYRFLDMEDYAKTEEDRYHEERIQKHTFDLLKRDGADDLRALKESIRANGYLPVDTLVVRPYAYSEGENYVVVEGNRRVAAMRWLLSDHYESGVSLDEETEQSFYSLPAIRIHVEDERQEVYKYVVLGSRHVSGIKEWGGYQRAKIILEMVDEYGFSVSDTALKLGMTSYEAMRRYRAIKALQQMKQDEEFASFASPDMYRLFHEAVSGRAIKSWLGWNDEEFCFTSDRRRDFYRMLVPYSPEDEEYEDRREREPKIRTYRDVRSLRDIIGNEDAEAVLLDPEQSFTEALAIAKAAEGTNWHPKIKAAHQAMERLGVGALKYLPPERIQVLRDLVALISERIEDWEKLTGS